ncbi:MAG: winged helix-turn-helix domain-containing protein, partial [Rickettsiales bacterium]|nr:winged helix-turn-helix domain-containing protein [Rickettsiales bacterium]
MAEAPIVIVCPDRDFTEVLAEQAQAELGLACATYPDFKAAEAGLSSASVVVATEMPPGMPPGMPRTMPEFSGYVVLARKPVRLSALLSEIAQGRQQQGEDVALSGGYVLKLRAKLLCRGQGACDVTDKEIAILQHLNAAGAEGLSREALLKNVWGIDSSLDTHTLETHIYRLR